jgi:hypothetical protein
VIKQCGVFCFRFSSSSHTSARRARVPLNPILQRVARNGKFWIPCNKSANFGAQSGRVAAVAQAVGQGVKQTRTIALCWIRFCFGTTILTGNQTQSDRQGDNIYTHTRIQDHCKKRKKKKKKKKRRINGKGLR